jgi:hypothetical protein
VNGAPIVIKFLAACLAALGASLPAAAVYLSGSGMGQALIYPYYTVRSTEGNAFNTYISIGNADAGGKALRVRFREARNGREVLGFNLFLQPGAVWAAALVPGPNGARLLTRDPTCSIPDFNVLTGSPAYLDLGTALFTGANADGMGESEDRVREGYVEVLEMASLPASFSSGTACGSATGGVLLSQASAPSGYLYGSLTVINVQSGLDFTVPADALAQLATAAYYRAPSDPYPDFTASEVSRVASFTLDNKLYRIEMPTGVGAVEAALVRSSIVNEIALDPVTASATDWVVTLPTRRFHAAGIASPWFAAALDPRGGDMALVGTYRSRNGANAIIEPNCGFLCPPNTYELTVRAPWAVTVLGFSSVSGSRPTGGAGITAALGSTNGWNIGLPNAGSGGGASWRFFNMWDGTPRASVNAVTTRLSDGVVANERISLEGLPVVGFMARTLRNGAIPCTAGTCQGNYGGSISHRLRRSIFQ